LNFLAKFVSKNQKDWNFFGIAGVYSPSKHKFLAFLYQNYISYELRLLLDLFRDHPSETESVLSKKEFPLKLRKKNYSQGC